MGLDMHKNIFVFVITVLFIITNITTIAFGHNFISNRLNISNYLDTNSNCCTKNSLISSKNPNSVNKEHTNVLKTIIWNNGAPTDYWYIILSQLDKVFPFNAQVADDFMFEDSDKEVLGVSWWGNFWGVGKPFDPVDFNIHFYADDGTGNAPTGGGMENPESTALKSYFIQNVSGINDSGQRLYSVDLSTPFDALKGEKYWLVVQAVFEVLPKWGRVTNEGTIYLSPSVYGCLLLGNPFWTDPALGDMAWYLTGGKNEPPSKPEINGPTRGKPCVEICFTFQSTDPDGDDVMYIIDWGDGNITETDFYQHSVPVEVCHTWYEKGCYLFRCKAKDIYGAESECIERLFWVDDSRISFVYLFQRYLERFPIMIKLIFNFSK